MLEEETNLLREKVNFSKASLDKYKKEKKILFTVLLIGLVKTEIIFFQLVNEDDWSLKEINKKEERINPLWGYIATKLFRCIPLTY